MKVADCPFYDRLTKLQTLSCKTTMSHHKPEHEHDLMRDSETGTLYVYYHWSTAAKAVHEIMTLEEIRKHDVKIHALALDAARSIGFLA